jgi:hypothetical protein
MPRRGSDLAKAIVSVIMERGPAQRNGRAGPLRGMNCPESGRRRGKTSARLHSDRSSTSPIRCAPLLSRRLARRLLMVHSLLPADFLTAMPGHRQGPDSGPTDHETSERTAATKGRRRIPRRAQLRSTGGRRAVHGVARLGTHAGVGVESALTAARAVKPLMDPPAAGLSSPAPA